jgi:alpha-glucosidase
MKKLIGLLRSLNPKRCRVALATALQSRGYSRRDFLATTIAAPVLIANLRTAKASASIGSIVKSPNGQIRFLLLADGAQLRYRVFRNNHLVIDASPIGITIDGLDLSREVEVRGLERYRVKEKYPARGVQAEAVNNCNGAKISLTHLPSRTSYTVEVRCFDDGVAFRSVVPGNGRRVPDEATAFTLPAGSVVWFHDFEGHYEGTYSKKELSEVKTGEWAAPPLTIKLPDNAGYASIAEAALINYAGMGLQADGRGFKAVLGHALPVSHPFDLRYGKEEAKRLAQPAAIEGTITTPWRVVMIGADLNTLVNCDIINNVSPPPDRSIFPAGLHTEWLKPGRAVWKYLDGGDSTFEGMKEFSLLAGRLGFEYNVVEGFWQKWSEGQMRELVDYSRQQRVGLWFWKHSKDLRTAATRDEFFGQLQRVGVVGAKIDFSIARRKRSSIFIRLCCAPQLSTG